MKDNVFLKIMIQPKKFPKKKISFIIPIYENTINSEIT